MSKFVSTLFGDFRRGPLTALTWPLTAGLCGPLMQESLGPGFFGPFPGLTWCVFRLPPKEVSTLQAPRGPPPLNPPRSTLCQCSEKQNRNRKSPQFSVANVPVPSQTAVGTLSYSKNSKNNCNRLRFFVARKNLGGGEGRFWGPKSRCDLFTCVRKSQSQSQSSSCHPSLYFQHASNSSSLPCPCLVGQTLHPPLSRSTV